jgi:predicted NAD/FAD-dependent oxidoreductase
LEVLAPALLGEARRARFSSCHALLVGLGAPLPVEFDAATIEGSPLAWAARSASKPGRGPGEAWVAHASASWSEAHLELPAGEVAPLLFAALAEALGAPLPAPRLLAAHRWRYALASAPLEQGCLFDPEARVGACGDWCRSPRVEGAWLSGVALAGRLLGG